jgi:hypothetical protein
MLRMVGEIGLWGDDCCHGWIIVLNEWMFC